MSDHAGAAHLPQRADLVLAALAVADLIKLGHHVSILAPLAAEHRGLARLVGREVAEQQPPAGRPQLGRHAAPRELAQRVEVDDRL